MKIKNIFKNKIIYITLLTSLVSAGVGTVIINHLKSQISSNLIKVNENQNRLTVHQVARGIGFAVNNTETSLKIMAVAPEIVNTSNIIACNDKLEEFTKSTNNQIGNLGRVNKDGTFVCSLNSKLIGLKASTLGDYVPRLINDPKHNTVMSYKIKPPGINSYAAAVHVPVYDHGSFAGTLGGAIYFDQIKDRYLRDIKFGTDGTVILIDNNGDILYHKDNSLIGKNIHSNDVRKLYTPSDTLVNLIDHLKPGSKGRLYYTFDGIHKSVDYEAFSVPGRQMVALVSTAKSDVDSVIGRVGLNTAFLTIITILSSSIGLLTFITLFNQHKSKRLQNAKDQFVSLVSHQLRTPLTSIRLFSELLGEAETGPLNPKQEEYVNVISTSTTRMIKLVSDILNVTRMELGRLQVRPTSIQLEEAISSKISEIQPIADSKLVKIVFNPPSPILPKIYVDNVLFDQIIHNLLTNAIRYAPDKNGEVKINLSNSNGAYLLCVSDNGIGIPAKDQKKIFSRFYRAENAKLKVGEGTGLGLYLIKLICESSNCKIRFSSTENIGTAFYVTIPLSGMQAREGDRSLSNT